MKTTFTVYRCYNLNGYYQIYNLHPLTGSMHIPADPVTVELPNSFTLAADHTGDIIPWAPNGMPCKVTGCETPLLAWEIGYHQEKTQALKIVKDPA